MTTEGNGAAPEVKTCHRSIGLTKESCIRERCTMYVQLNNGQSDCLEVRVAAAQLNNAALAEMAMKAQAQANMGGVVHIDPRKLRTQ